MWTDKNAVARERADWVGIGFGASVKLHRHWCGLGVQLQGPSDIISLGVATSAVGCFTSSNRHAWLVV